MEWRVDKGQLEAYAIDAMRDQIAALVPIPPSYDPRVVGVAALLLADVRFVGWNDLLGINA